MHGYADVDLRIFSNLLVIFNLMVLNLSLLSACSHVDMVEKRWAIFGKREDYGVEKNDKDYVFMLDILHRAELIDQAVDLLKRL